MRKFFIPLLMAGAMLPAAALAQDAEHRGDNRAERAAERAAERGDRGNREAVRVERGERGERPQQIERVAVEPRAERRFERREMPQVQQVEQQTIETAPVQRVGRERGDRSIVDALREQAAAQQSGQDGTDVRRGDRDGGRDGRRDRVRDGDRRLGDLRSGGDRRWGDSGGGSDHRRWSGDWRRDHRYDWRRHRDHNRFIFRIGSYYDPYGWGYRRFSIGYNLWPSYYSSRYWLADPWMYRLPPAYGPYRWVRYYDDALLVNIYTGQVVDVINNFFW